MEIVDSQEERAPGREGLEQRPHRAQGAVTLLGGLSRRSAGPPGERRQHGCKTGDVVRAGTLERTWVERGEVVVERVHEGPERHPALELGAAASEHEHPARAGPLGERSQKARLADAGLARDAGEHGAAASEQVERAVEGRCLSLPSAQSTDSHSSDPFASLSPRRFRDFPDVCGLTIQEA